MNNYYEEMIQNVEKLMTDGKYSDALDILEDELKMPYIPCEIERKLLILFKDCQTSLKVNVKANKSLDDEELEEYLNGSNDLQLKAVEYLNGLNLRNYERLVNEYLKNNPFCMARALLIDSLIDQGITYEVTVNIHGQDIAFIPRYIEKATESDGFVEACKFINDEFGNDNPTMEKMCMQLLIQEAYLRCPINFEEGEGEFVALSVICEVYKMLQDEEELLKFIQKHANCSEKIIELYSVKIDY